jgi:hypothetical protein
MKGEHMFPLVKVLDTLNTDASFEIQLLRKVEEMLCRDNASTQTTIRLPDSIMKSIESIAERTDLKKSDIIRFLLAWAISSLDI